VATGCILASRYNPPEIDSAASSLTEAADIVVGHLFFQRPDVQLPNY
jgi:hypothetical protein